MGSQGTLGSERLVLSGTAGRISPTVLCATLSANNVLNDDFTHIYGIRREKDVWSTVPHNTFVC